MIIQLKKSLKKCIHIRNSTYFLEMYFTRHSLHKLIGIKAIGESKCVMVISQAAQIQWVLQL